MAVDRTKLCRGTVKRDVVTPPSKLYTEAGKRNGPALALFILPKAGLKVSANQFDRMDYIGLNWPLW